MRTIKRPKTCPFCKKVIVKAVHTSKETHDPDGTPQLTDVLLCPHCKKQVAAITFGDQ